MNYVVIDGILGTEPEIKTTTTGKKVARLFVLNNEYIPGKPSGSKESYKSNAFNAVAWQKQADSAEGLHKGDRVLLTGTLNQREFEQNGAKRSVLEINVKKIGLLNFMEEKKEAPSQQVSDDDYPF